MIPSREIKLVAATCNIQIGPAVIECSNGSDVSVYVNCKEVHLPVINPIKQVLSICRERVLVRGQTTELTSM